MISDSRLAFLFSTAAFLISACSSAKPNPPSATPAPVTAVARDSSTSTATDSTSVADSSLSKRVAILELKLLEKEAQIDDLQARLEEMRTAVVQARGQVQTANGRAEAASGMAEAEVALQSLKSIAPAQHPDAQQATRLLSQSSEAFDNENFGGALYLAGQAKTLALAARARLVAANRLPAVRRTETPFAVPIRLKVTLPGNVRDGPGADFPIAFAVEGGAALTGLSHDDEWIKVTDERRRSGWINRSLVARR